VTRRPVEPHRLVIVFQQAPPTSLTGAPDADVSGGEALLKPAAALVDARALMPAETTEIEVRISTEWLLQLGWTRQRPELRMVLNSEGIHITPLYPSAEEQPRRFELGAGDMNGGQE
jgi:hypothetical protein